MNAPKRMRFRVCGTPTIERADGKVVLRLTTWWERRRSKDVAVDVVLVICSWHALAVFCDAARAKFIEWKAQQIASMDATLAKFKG